MGRHSTQLPIRMLSLYAHTYDSLTDAYLTHAQEHGPWRAFWCFWGEAFIQYLKRLFEMTNHKSAAYHVADLSCGRPKQTSAMLTQSAHNGLLMRSFLPTTTLSN